MNIDVWLIWDDDDGYMKRLINDIETPWCCPKPDFNVKSLDELNKALNSTHWDSLVLYDNETLRFTSLKKIGKIEIKEK